MSSDEDAGGRAHRPDPGSDGRLPDISVTPPEGPVPLTRMAPERRLRRVDRYQRRAEMTAYERLTSTGTVLISFRVVDDQPFVFETGHFIGIQAEVRGFGRRRSPYCIVSLPNDERTFQLLVRIVPEGPLSLYLTELEVGDVISFRGPMGRSMMPKHDDEMVFLATGVGIGPPLALLHQILPEGPERKVRLFWGVRLEEDLCLLDELDDLHRRHPSFDYSISLTRPPEGWQELRGRLTETVPPLLETLGGKRYCMVGNGAMIQEMADALSDMGVDRTLIHEEIYFNVKHRPDPAVLAAIRKRFVATDLYSPYSSQEQGLYMPERGLSRGKG